MPSLGPGCKTLFSIFCALGLEGRMAKKCLWFPPRYDSVIKSEFQSHKFPHTCSTPILCCRGTRDLERVTG